MPASADKALEGLLAEGVTSYEVLDALSGAGFEIEGPTDEPPGEFSEESEMEESEMEEPQGGKAPLALPALPAFGPEARERAYNAAMK